MVFLLWRSARDCLSDTPDVSDTSRLALNCGGIYGMTRFQYVQTCPNGWHAGNVKMDCSRAIFINWKPDVIPKWWIDIWILPVQTHFHSTNHLHQIIDYQPDSNSNGIAGAIKTFSSRSLIHWGRVTHICVSNPTIISSDNGLLPDRHQAIICTSAGILLIGPLEANFSENLIGIQTFSFYKMHLKLSSAKWRPFCLGLNMLRTFQAKIQPCGVGFTEHCWDT